MSRFAVWLLPGILVLAGLAAYRGTYSSPFVFDDATSIGANASIRHLAAIGKVLRPPGGGQTVTGRPLVNLSLAVNYAIGGLSPRGYHAFNLAIHLLAGLTLFGIARRDFGKERRRFRDRASVDRSSAANRSGDLRFAARGVADGSLPPFDLVLLCPVERAVTAASGGSPRRAASGDGARVLRGPERDILRLRHGDEGDDGFNPLLILLYDRTFRAGSFREALRTRGRYYASLAATWILLAYCVATSGNRGGTAGFETGVKPWHYALFQSTAVLHYLRLCLWPHPLIFDYGTSLAAPPSEIAVGCAALAALLAATGWALRRRPPWGFLGAWFFLLLAPSSSIVPVATQVMAEHRIYLSLAAVLAALVCTAARWVPFWLPASLIAAAILGVVTLARNADYRSARALWAQNVADRPNNPRAREQLAVALSQDPALLTQAAAEDEAALRIDPDDAVAHNNLGNVFLRLPGRLPEAVAQFRAALRTNPRSATYCNTLAAALARLPGEATEAAADYQQALQLDPDYALAHEGLGNLLAVIPGRAGDAISEFEATLRLDPDNAEARNNLALLYAQTGRLPEAIRELERVVRTHPGFAGARQNLEALRSEQTEPSPP